MGLFAYQADKVIVAYIELIGKLVHLGRQRIQALTGYDPAGIYLPVSEEEFTAALQVNLMFQIAFSDYQGQIIPNPSKGKLWDFFTNHPIHY